MACSFVMSGKYAFAGESVRWKINQTSEASCVNSVDQRLTVKVIDQVSCRVRYVSVKLSINVFQICFNSVQLSVSVAMTIGRFNDSFNGNENLKNPT